MLTEIVASISIIIILLLKTYTVWVYKYWARKNVPFLKPSFPFGNFSNPFTNRDYIGVLIKDLYDQFRKKGTKHAGIYAMFTPIYLIVDLEIIKYILQKDFHHFVDRGFYYNEKDDPLSANLFAIGEQKWKHLRTKLTPTFTSGKMKLMFSTLLQCGKQLEEAMDGYSKVREPIDIKEVIACFTTDVIGSVIFGLECNCFKSRDAEFRKYGKEIFKFNRIEALKVTFSMYYPSIARKMKLLVFHQPVTNFFKKIVRETVEFRKMNNFTRNDMLQVLLDVREKDIANNDPKALTMDQLTAQVFAFFAAGFESSSLTISFCLFELAINPYIQDRLRNEIKHVLDKYNGEITYDCIMEMKYMGQVVNETLRKYPPLGYITRRCDEDYVIPDTNILIQKGTKIMISILGIQRDREYFPDPDRFDPERFSDERKQNIHPFTYIPFGEGPRSCIGMRFGLMQIKVGLSILLRDYRFSLNNKTVLPLVWNPNSIALQPVEGIWLDIEKIN